MADDTVKQRKKIATLLSSLGDLEKELGSLLSQTLPETATGLDTIQQAKLNVLIPYLVYDLVFIYLKTRGIDPKTHPVVVELDRVKQYFSKVKAAESPRQRTTALDKAAAARFINHAINSANNPSEEGNEPHDGATSSAETVEQYVPRVTAKMVERAEWEHEVREEMQREDAEEDVLEVFDAEDTAIYEETAEGEDQGNIRNPDSTSDSEKLELKRRRQAADFFEVDGLSPGKTAAVTETASKRPKKKKKKATADAETPNGKSTQQPAVSLNVEKKKKRRKVSV